MAPSGDRRRGTVTLTVVVALAVPLLFTGCHDRERLRERLEGPAPARLPVEPDQPDTPPAPALLDIVRPWKQPAPYPARVTNTWPIVELHANDEYDLTWRVPFEWHTDDAKARNRSGTISAEARVTTLDELAISLASYAAQLAEGNPIWQYSTSDGHVVYLTRREVAIAPSDPDAPREEFHTAVVNADGTILKLDVRYDVEQRWRFADLADAITGTLQLRRRDG